MTALITTVFLASLAGSLHCAGMCGVFVTVATAGPAHGRRSHAGLQAAYHGGRLLTYVALGTLAGAVGAALDLGGSVAGVQRLALAAAGAAMVVIGALSLARIGGYLRGHGPVASAMTRAYRKLAGGVAARPPYVRALLLGLATTMLPCGWLYVFAIAAAGTGSAARGALAMAVFWIGTLPVMVSIGAGARVLAGPLRRHLPGLTAVALVVVGLFALAGRMNVPPLDASSGAAAEAHAEHGAPVALGEAHCREPE